MVRLLTARGKMIVKKVYLTVAKQIIHVLCSQRTHPIIPRTPRQPPAVISSTPQLCKSTPMTPMGLVMAGCWQINSILTNIGRTNSIQISNQYPCFWNILIWTQFICLINFFCVFKIKVALISCRLSKVPSKAGENNGLIRPPAESVPGLNNREIAPISSSYGVGVENQTTLALPLGSDLVGLIWLKPCSGYDCTLTGEVWVIFCECVGLNKQGHTVLTHWGWDKNGCLSTDDIFKRIFLNENVWISITISLKFVPKGLINNIPALVQIMAWRRPGDKPLSEPMLVGSLTHVCVTRPQWVNSLAPGGFDYSLKLVNFKLISMINILSIFCEIAIRWMRQHLTDHYSTLVQVMAWCRQATSHYLSQ